MRFAEPVWLLGTLFALVVLGIYVLGGLSLLRATSKFGLPAAVEALLTSKRVGGRRALKGGFVVLAVAAGFVALAGPQYGRGTRLIPATNLDVVIVLDYSKSMYAKDVTPSRTERAKVEVTQLIKELPGVRFGAVAFAGEPISFPLTSDGGAVAQFFRQNSPRDMPVGGTAIARALESARNLLQRDRLSKKHKRVILLVTDGEDLEGNPVDVAEAAGKEGTIVHVVQIGGRAAETIPKLDETGRVTGIMRDREGRPLTTSLSAEGEEQLAQVAKSAAGSIVRSGANNTGIDEITKSLKGWMTDELSERVETVFADIYFYPLGLAVLLLLLETFVPLGARRRETLGGSALLQGRTAPPKRAASSKRTKGVSAVLLLFTMLGCERIEQALFWRHSPVVDDAVSAIKTRDAGTARLLLTDYLSTGECTDGTFGVPKSVRDNTGATFDLGLALFEIAERFGGRFGEQPPEAQDPAADEALAERSGLIDCALSVVRVIGSDRDNPTDVRSQALFLSGNLEFLRHDYRAAVSSYDEALPLMPGQTGDAGSSFGSDIAFNRSIALLRAEEAEKDPPEPPDAGPGDGGSNQEGEPDEQQDQKQDKDEQQDQEQDKDEQQDQQEQEQDQQEQDQQEQDQQEQDQQQPSPEEQQEQESPQPSLGQDQRMLDALERAPMFPSARPRRRRTTMEDK